MGNYGELLQGFVGPQLMDLLQGPDGKWEYRTPLGENGLTARVLMILLFWETLRKISHRRLLSVEVPANLALAVMLRNVVLHYWMSEMLRVLDNAKFGSGKGAKDNLSVRLCQERLQADPNVPDTLKADSERRFTMLINCYDAAGLKTVRDKAMFHLDQQTTLAGGVATADMAQLTPLLVDWFRVVATAYYRHHRDVSAMIEQARQSGLALGRDYRRMLIEYGAKRRARTSRPPPSSRKP
jgi:hypothetical protein